MISVYLKHCEGRLPGTVNIVDIVIVIGLVGVFDVDDTFNVVNDAFNVVDDAFNVVDDAFNVVDGVPIVLPKCV